MTRGSNHARRLQSATFRGCVAVLEAPETASCAVWVAQPARSLHMRRPPMAASERDSSRPSVTNVPSVPGNRDYFTTFSQANV
jgi:hypothetical protein